LGSISTLLVRPERAIPLIINAGAGPRESAAMKTDRFTYTLSFYAHQ